MWRYIDDSNLLWASGWRKLHTTDSKPVPVPALLLLVVLPPVLLLLLWSFSEQEGGVVSTHPPTECPTARVLFLLGLQP